MNQYLAGSQQSRGVVLVASDSAVFASIVGDMVAESGFTSTHIAASELAWISVGPLRPCLVICDCESPAKSVQHLLAEVAGRIPLLLSQSGPKPEIASALKRARRVAWFTFPISREAFSATLETVLLTPATHRFVGHAAGATLDAGISVRDLAVASRRVIS
jgi:DNA-binding NtrC family response regulator